MALHHIGEVKCPTSLVYPGGFLEAHEVMRLFSSFECGNGEEKKAGRVGGESLPLACMITAVKRTLALIRSVV